MTNPGYQPEQMLLFPPDLRGWLPPGHPADQVGDPVDALDPSPFHARCKGDGRRNSPYEPSMMAEVLIHTCATGVFSSRAIAKKLEDDAAFRVLAAGNFPRRRTLCGFRRRHPEEFGQLFVEVARMGVVRFGALSVDGTKVRACASRRKAMGCGRMLKEEARLREGMEGLPARAGAVDDEEGSRHGRGGAGG